MAELIRVGHVLAPFGVQGAVKVYVIGDPEQLLDLTRVSVEKLGWLRVTGVELHGPGVVMALAGVADRTAAERLRNRGVYVDEAELPPLDDGSYYYHELTGLPVVAPDGRTLGDVRDVMDGGHQDLLVVRHPRGESLVPLQAPYVEVVRGERIVLDAPPGLLGDEPGDDA
ncbi:ribosome maturation factor RimM [Deinococcus maricopensis]|uniref:Ribosome maturation factor RimM n=1 Tax=Deinococcus maricopensis (strain DSM 21211 / LMG 22137 / NRRL B-23946 / LB-34) TaxID=709986 RepID=E8UAE4_DEIML|nr:ribosome maturation factor RimM [Deinococcus maricopensis]ADV68033.1 Ribosome maturation factor rimM [Deinococcus maricopensis DSM 21211]